MIDFRPPNPSDFNRFEALLLNGKEAGCEYNFTTNLLWKDYYGIDIAEVCECFTARYRNCGYLFPSGVNIEDALDALEADSKERREVFQLAFVNHDHIGFLRRKYGFRIHPSVDRGSWDYLYDISALVDLSGRKLHAKRNHIKRFIIEHPNYSFEPMDPESAIECLKIDSQWRIHNQERDNPAEQTAIETALTNFEELRLDGGVLRSDGKVIAFTLGSRINHELYDVHFEKAIKEITGAYAVINHEFAKMISSKYSDIRYINREDDLGIEGLRKAKEAYYPKFMIQKYTVLIETEHDN